MSPLWRQHTRRFEGWLRLSTPVTGWGVAWRVLIESEPLFVWIFNMLHIYDPTLGTASDGSPARANDMKSGQPADELIVCYICFMFVSVESPLWKHYYKRPVCMCVQKIILLRKRLKLSLYLWSRRFLRLLAWWLHWPNTWWFQWPASD